MDEVVAVVGSRIVLRSEIEVRALQLVQGRGTAPTVGDVREALRQSVDQQVLATVAERDTTIEVTAEQVEQALGRRLQQLTQQVGGEDRLEAIYGKPLVQIRDDFRRDIRDGLLVQQLQGRKVQGIRITPSEVAAWFARIPTDSLPTFPPTVRIAHIVRRLEPTAAAKTEAIQALTVLRDSVAGGKAAFEDLARQFSEDPGSAENGGRIADLRLSELVPEFAAVAARLTPGEVSPPFETVFGYHILRVNSRRGDVVDFSHILLRVSADAADTGPATAYLNAVRDSMATFGIAFERMARVHSQDEASAQQGGRVTDPRTRSRDLITDALGSTWKATLDTMDVGEISRPVPVELLDGRAAVHIVQLQSRAPEHRVSLATDYARIEEIALQEKQNRELRAWADGLRREVYVEYRGRGQELMATAGS